MAQLRAWTFPKSTGDKVEPSEFNALNDLPMARGGANPLLDDASIDLGAFSLFIANASAGIGRFDVDADFFRFSGAGYPAFASPRSLSNIFPAYIIGTGDPTSWQDAGSYWEQGAIGPTRLLHVRLALPVGLTIASLTMRLRNPNTGASLPATMPYLQVLRRAHDSELSTSLGDATDASADATAYKALHALTVTGINHEVAAGYDYFAILRGESGAGSVGGLRCYRPSISGSVAALRAI